MTKKYVCFTLTATYSSASFECFRVFLGFLIHSAPYKDVQDSETLIMLKGKSFRYQRLYFSLFWLFIHLHICWNAQQIPIRKYHLRKEVSQKEVNENHYDSLSLLFLPSWNIIYLFTYLGSVSLHSWRSCDSLIFCFLSHEIKKIQCAFV